MINNRIKYFKPAEDSNCVIAFKDGEFCSNEDCSISIGSEFIKTKIVKLKKGEKLALNKIRLEYK